MKITFIGAAKTVTGSCYLIEAAGKKFLVDCGMFQGHANEEGLNTLPFSFNPAELDFVLLTHAHIDHSGRIPKLFLDGFKGQVIATKATVELSSLLLPDSGHIQEFEAEWQNRKSMRAGKEPVKPLYTAQDATDCLKYFKSVNYGQIVNLGENLKVKFNDAGHILGSSIIELWAVEDGKETKAVFSGDLGNKGTPILKDPAIISEADILLIESTYGNRLHTDNSDKVEKLINIIDETIEHGGNVVIPSFAVGRTQEMIYDLNKRYSMHKSKLDRIINIPVYVDSPLAVSATEVFRNNLDCFDEEAREYIKNGDNPLDFPGLRFTRTSDESKALNELQGSSIIISASGMCDAGRIKHHLKHNLWRKESTILFVGYQAEGTLGRRLVDGAKRVKIFGEEITVNARIEVIDGFSGHADRDGLLEWLGGFTNKSLKLFLVHGEEKVISEFAENIRVKFGMDPIIPSRGEEYSLGEIPGKHAVTAVSAPDFAALELLTRIKRLKEDVESTAEKLALQLKTRNTEAELSELSEKLKLIENILTQTAK